jgi:hypothetical protein
MNRDDAVTLVMMAWLAVVVVICLAVYNNLLDLERQVILLRCGNMIAHCNANGTISGCLK